MSVRAFRFLRRACNELRGWARTPDPRRAITPSPRLALLVTLACTTTAGAADARSPGSPPKVEPGMEVAVEYTISDRSGTTLETNRGEAPLVFVAGREDAAMIPAVEQALTGLHAGDEKDITLGPDEAYGPTSSEAFQRVQKDKIPPAAQKVGAVLQARSTDGRSVPVRVAEITDDAVVLDFNHPLAGKTLVFHLKVVGVKPRSAAPEGPAAGPLPVEIPR